ncbi:putative amidoligase enzyme-domain-containing protein [Xylaria castorea]|nr:putative amidoligase enzyme-domain-containing protein [Xylaria castorea]
MALDQQTKTFTVPVGTRLSHGVELEMLVAYLHRSDVDPDGANSENLAPILRVDTGGINNDGNDDLAFQDAVEGIVEEHIRKTLRNHGISVSGPELAPISEDIPLHLYGFGQWDVTTDVSVHEGIEEKELAQGKPGQYRWLGLELRTPACWDEPRAYDEIRFVVNLMKSKYRVRLNPSCGLHVHVANGPRYFDAKTLKRAGAFFFAADPMLSRLHAPWRRVGPFTPSIRYASQLAHLDEARPIHAQMPSNSVAALFRGKHPPTASFFQEYLPVVPWSDRSREEKDFGGELNGGMANWERHANERVRDGPHITLSERPRTPESSVASEDPTPHPPSLSSSSFSPPSHSSDNGSDDEGGGLHHHRLLRLMATPGFRDTCLRNFNHEHPEILRSEEQFGLLVVYQCEHLFGHASPNLLSDAQYYDLTVACAPYIEVGRSSWEWDARTNDFTMKDAPIGNRLEHPRPQTLRQTNGREVVLSLQALAEVQEAEGERRASQQSEDDTRAPDGDGDIGNIEADRNIWRQIYYDCIDRLMTHPTFPLENVDNLLAQFPEPVSNASGSFNPPASKALAAAYPDGNSGTSPSNSDSSTPTTNTNGSFDSPAGKAMPARVFKVPGTPTTDAGDSFSKPAGKAMPARAFRVPGTPTTDASDSSDKPAGKAMFARAFEVPGTPSSESSTSTNASRVVNNGGNEFGFLFPKATTGGAFDSLDGIPSSPDNSPGTGGDFNPPAFATFMASPSHENDDHEASDQSSSTSSSFLSNASPAHPNSRITGGHKLRPHDIYQLPDSYVHRVSRLYNFDSARWQRISWLPYPGGPPDPNEKHPRGGEACAGPECTQHVVTDTRAGLATILGMDSGAAVGELLHAVIQGDRANYNFTAYELDNLRLPTWPRTLEFREAGGSLDPDWIITWVNICVGILRFCRDASVIDFITVLERVVREEERQRTPNPERNDEGMYDACDLLEDMCLFAEATTVRERERKFGPPR